MTATVLARFFEHNNWANGQIIQACVALSDEQLDAEPRSATLGSIRSTLLHLVTSQRGYLRFLTLPLEDRLGDPLAPPPFADVGQVARESGESLLALARDEALLSTVGGRQTRDGVAVEPWVVLVQAINHAAEHREQISSMLSALGVTPPCLDGWCYGEVAGALAPTAR